MDFNEDVKVVVFRLKNIEFGVPINQVQSIERMTQLTKMPKSPAYIRGIMDFRDGVMPVIDLMRVLLQEDLIESDLTRIITIKHNGKNIGILTDAATDVIDIAGTTIQQHNMIGDYDASFIRGIANLPNRLLIIIDIHNLLDNISSNTEIDISNLLHGQTA